MAKPGSSVARVEAEAEALGLAIEIRRMPATTRTAVDAAAACGCGVGQIVKSLIFEGADTGVLKLLLVSGANQVDMERARQAVGEALKRCDANRVRDETGFAIGGVAPLGHKAAVAVWMDEDLLQYDVVWAAAGAPNAVFSIAPAALRDATEAEVCRLK